MNVAHRQLIAPRCVAIALLALLFLARLTDASSIRRPGVVLSPVARAGVDAVFSAFGKKTPGCAIGIYAKGRVLYAKGYGMASLEYRVPITPHTVFDIGSASKQFTATAIALLVQDGRLAYADDVRKYLPELPDYGATLTIDELLHHTSGLRDYNGLLELAGHFEEDYTDANDALQIIGSQKALNFAPRSQWSYSNTGYFLLGVIVERVSGMSLAEFARTKLFLPLGMTVTQFRTDHTALLPDRATAYSKSSDGQYAIDMSNWDQIGDGGINTNVLELARWDRNFYFPLVGGRRLIESLQEPGYLANGTSVDYGRGLFIGHYRGLRRIYHAGAWAGYRAMLMRFPDEGIAIGLTCNVADAATTSLAESVADVVLAARFKQTKPEARSGRAPVARLDPAPYVGTYLNDDGDSIVRVESDSGVPVLWVSGARLPLDMVAGGQFLTRGAPASVRFDANRNVLRLTSAGRPDEAYRRIVAPPEVVDVADFSGKFFSAELGVIWTVSVVEKHLVVAGRAFGELSPEPIKADTFATTSAMVAFCRGSDGVVDGFDLSISRIRRINFVRVGQGSCKSMESSHED